MYSGYAKISSGSGLTDFLVLNPDSDFDALFSPGNKKFSKKVPKLEAVLTCDFVIFVPVKLYFMTRISIGSV